MLALVPDLEFVRYQKEIFPQPRSDFDRLFELHGREVRGKAFDLDYRRYHQIEFEGRLIWIVARSMETGQPLGYACSFWYRDLHFDERVAAEDLWFVDRNSRKLGIGKAVKIQSHIELKKLGVTRVYDTIRRGFNNTAIMHGLGYREWGTRWVKDLIDTAAASAA
jgi:hypothetical protein